ncbi:HK97-gp10 family putative phage morphogenesis protein [Brucella pituitosa]|uniref:HK97 gp10 family phage protein n=1 Tax=Brucella pituitosa TaxID=571256 RepID=A0A643EXE7_9HYPH|nr:HK97-gp10 family putative phage morphogenesis protein [Brucella pituitosa]KAB0570584.1 HK97 gp10 family phage protein [Brucella pituitosa]
MAQPKYDAQLRNLKDRLARIPEAMRERLMAETETAANEIADQIRNFAPVDDGDLKESITVTGPGHTTPPHSQPGGSQTVPEGVYMITAGNSKVRYAHLVEWGTEKNEAQPFFFPAIRLKRKKTKAALRRAARKALKETAT